MPDLRLIRNVSIPARTLTCVATLFVAALLTSAQSAFAQDATEPAPPHISVVDGDVTLARDVDTNAADVGMPVVAGDRLRTRQGRAEVLFPDGSALDLDEFSEIDVQSPQLLRLMTGRVKLLVPRDSTARFQLDTPAGTAYLDEPGEYRIAVLGEGAGMQTELAVTRGRAELAGDRGSVDLQAGERSLARANDVPSRAEPFNSARYDAFDRWTMDQRDARVSSASVQYLPPDLRVYGSTLDRSGSWQYESNYGYVWYPSVGVDWRPYYTGYWASVPLYGWTWIGAERWAWPTHHYGRWGYARNRWFWIPERRFAPAWVSWGAAPGYVSWCPLGFDNRPVFALSVSVGNGWVVLPRDRFGIRGERVNRYAVSARSLSPRTPFIQQAAPPIAPFRSGAQRAGGVPLRDTRSRADDRNRAFPRPDQPRADSGTAVRRNPAAPPAPTSGGALDQSRARRREPQTFGDSGRASRENGVAVPRAVPRAPRPQIQSTQPPAAQPGTAAQPRRYPFGDFRQRSAPPDSPAAQPDSAPATAAPRQAVPRTRQFDPQQDRRAISPGRAPAPNDNRRGTESNAPAAAAPAPPRAPSVVGRPSREDGNRGGSISGSPRAERGSNERSSSGSGGAAVQRAPRQDQGSGASSGASAPRGEGRSHDPGSRRPR